MKNTEEFINEPDIAGSELTDDEAEAAAGGRDFSYRSGDKIITLVKYVCKKCNNTYGPDELPFPKCPVCRCLLTPEYTTTHAEDPRRPKRR